MSEPTFKEKYSGALLGLACGDAVGTLLQWTDDTSMKVKFI